jgi:hypothetical protein
MRAYRNRPTSPLEATTSMQPSATLLFVAPRLKFEWYRMQIGPSTPSTMCTRNQARTLPSHAREGLRLRSGYTSSSSIIEPPQIPST